MDDAVDCLMSFSDFLLAFQIQFYYSGESPGPTWLLSWHMSLSYPCPLHLCARICVSPALPSVVSSAQVTAGFQFSSLAAT